MPPLEKQPVIARLLLSPSQHLHLRSLQLHLDYIEGPWDFVVQHSSHYMLMSDSVDVVINLPYSNFIASLRRSHAGLSRPREFRDLEKLLENFEGQGIRQEKSNLEARETEDSHDVVPPQRTSSRLPSAWNPYPQEPSRSLPNNKQGPRAEDPRCIVTREVLSVFLRDKYTSLSEAIEWRVVVGG
jgi:hypothetical protein